MTAHGIRYALAALGVTVAAVLLGMGVAGPEGREGVVAGGAFALALQVSTFWLLAVLLFPSRRFLVFGIGVLARLLGIAIAALLLIPALALPPAPTLLTLVAVLVLTTVLEPLVLHTATPMRS